MAGQSSAFPLRLRDARLRALIREVARREGVSQNEVIEHAVEGEMVVRGQLLAADLQAAADHLIRLTDAAHAELVARSVREFGEGEARPDPLAATALHAHAESRAPSAAGSTVLDRLGVLAAFNAGHR